MRSKFLLSRYLLYLALIGIGFYYIYSQPTVTHSRIKHKLPECRPNKIGRDRPVVIESFDQRQPECAVDCRYQTEGPLDLKADGYVLTMESSVYYPNTHPNVVRKKGQIAMTPRLDSDVPLGYFSWAEYNFMEQVPDDIRAERLLVLDAFAKGGSQVKPLAIAVISNCAANTFRLQAIEKLKALGVPISTYGACFPDSPQLPYKQESKIEQLRRHPFTLAFENSVEEDYVTEKFWHGLVAGSVPIVIGCNNAFDFDPQAQSSKSEIIGGGMLRIPSLADIPKVVKALQYLAANQTAYLELLSWKVNGPSDQYLALVDMAVVHSECRLCIYVGTSQLQQESQCNCVQNEQEQIRLLVRERGKFEFEDIFVDLQQLNISVQKAQFIGQMIRRHFQAKHYKPIWHGHRQDFRSSAEELQLYKVYHAGVTQREALYGGADIDSDVKVLAMASKPCPQLEVIFV